MAPPPLLIFKRPQKFLCLLKKLAFLAPPKFGENAPPPPPLMKEAINEKEITSLGGGSTLIYENDTMTWSTHQIS